MSKHLDVHSGMLFLLLPLLPSYSLLIFAERNNNSEHGHWRIYNNEQLLELMVGHFVVRQTVVWRASPLAMVLLKIKWKVKVDFHFFQETCLCVRVHSRRNMSLLFHAVPSQRIAF
jgi:hypothetical protein